jgi:hypothetical protein
MRLQLIDSRSVRIGIPRSTKMAKYYQTKLSGRARKKYTCCACGCAYAADVERAAAATGGLQAIAHERAARQLTERLKSAMDLQPCPTCGLIPPLAVARKTEYVHGFVWLGAAFAAAIVAGIGGVGVISFNATAAGVGGIVAAGVFIHAIIAASNPNHRRAANLERAEADVAAGVVELVQPGQPGAGAEPRSWTLRHSLGVLLAAAAPLVLIVPAYLRTTLTLPLNPKLSPQTVAIGTQFTATLPPPTFQSVEGRWCATPKIDVLNAKAIHAPATLPATSRAAVIGENISVAKGETNRSPTDMFCTLTIPDDPTLDGQTLQLRATLNVVYPVRTSKTTFERKVTTVTHEFPVVLAPKADFQKLNMMSLGAIVVALVGTMIGGGLLAWGIAAVKKQGAPAELVGVEQGVTA